MPPALLVTAALLLVLTDSPGLVPVLVVLAVSSTAVGRGARAGAGVAAAAGLIFIATTAWHERATGVGLILTAVAVPLWVFIAWAAGMTAEELRRLDGQLAGHVHELHHRALHDPLTGLANRDLLLDRLAPSSPAGRAPPNPRRGPIPTPPPASAGTSSCWSVTI